MEQYSKQAYDMAQTEIHPRDTLPAVRHGWGRRCPSCGKGRMMQGYLKVAHACGECGQEFYHHRADDGPAYLTILIVGHLMAPLLLHVFVTYRPDPWVMLAIFGLGCITLSLYLLPRLKVVIVAFQWARGMHGFGYSRQT